MENEKTNGEYEPLLDSTMGAAHPGEGHPVSGGSESAPQPTAAIPAVPAPTQALPVTPAAAPASASAAGEPVPSYFTNPPKKRSKKKRWIIGSVSVLVLAGLYSGFCWGIADRVPHGTTVAGVDISGMKSSDAIAALESGLKAGLAEHRDLTTSTKAAVVNLDPATIGLKLDAQATVKEFTGFSLNPMNIVHYFSGGEAANPVLTANEAELKKQIEAAATKLNVAPANASITITGTTAELTKAVKGVAVDEPAAEKTVLTQWFGSRDGIVLPTKESEPAVSDEKATEVLEKQLKPLLASPLSVTYNDQVAELTPQTFAPWVHVKAEGADLKVTMDAAPLNELLTKSIASHLQGPVDARIEIVDHTAPKIIPSVDGHAIDAEKLATELVAAGASGQRTVALPVKNVPATFTTADAEKMGIKEVVAEISTPLTSDRVRTTNLIVGTERVNNTLVKPGERFSLLKALGPVDAAHGFVASGVVENGFNSTAMGGGLSQLSTNTFNVGFRAGMIDIQHKPHSKYFSRYPMGMESTLWGPTLDMIWENNTPYGALVETWVAGGRVHTRLWSTKYWDVSWWIGKPHSYVQPTLKYNPAPDCEPSRAGGPGFTVSYGRTIKLDGKVVKEQTKSWRYNPVNAVTCTPPEQEPPAPAPQP